jgi:hypothetical protein
MLNAKEILGVVLADNGYDGLVNPWVGCCCGISSLMSCGCCYHDCYAAYSKYIDDPSTEDCLTIKNPDGSRKRKVTGIKLLEKWLKKNKYDGLLWEKENCWCTEVALDDCEGCHKGCVAAYKVPCVASTCKKDCDYKDDNDAPYCMSKEKS